MNLTPNNRNELVAYIAYKYIKEASAEVERGVSDKTATNIITRNYFKLYDKWRKTDTMVKQFHDLEDSKLALDVIKDLVTMNHLELLDEVANFTGTYKTMVLNELGITELKTPNAFDAVYGDGTTNNIRIIK
jgi:hypothetical protein